MNIAQLCELVTPMSAVLGKARDRLSAEQIPWYPYGTLGNLVHLSTLLPADLDFLQLTNGKPVLDIGSADGDLAFLLERAGMSVDAMDYPPTNFNRCRAIRALAGELNSSIGLHEVDLDSQFALPDRDYGLAIFLGILYHLKNPYFALEKLANRCSYLLLSTRVTRFDRPVDQPGRVNLADSAVGYLVAPHECNNDPTNYWMFSRTGLLRILDRTGWVVERHLFLGNVDNSDPASAEGDERAFILARSSQS